MIREKYLIPIRSKEGHRLFRMKAIALLAAGLFVTPITASSAMVTLTFEGVGNLAAVGNFYDGGGGLANDYDITFSSGGVALIDSDVAGGTGSFANEPSASTIMLMTSSDVILNRATGFDTQLSFYHAGYNGLTVELWTGLNASGFLIASGTFVSPSQASCIGDPTGIICSWSPESLSFVGTALSVKFLATGPNQIGLDSISLGSAPVPLPAAAWLLLSGLAGLGFVGRRRAAK